MVRYIVEFRTQVGGDWVRSGNHPITVRSKKLLDRVLFCSLEGAIKEAKAQRKFCGLEYRVQPMSLVPWNIASKV